MRGLSPSFFHWVLGHPDLALEPPPTNCLQVRSELVVSSPVA